MTSQNHPKKFLIAIFPLPTTVFYPETLLPLHIFEARYRQMVADALEGDHKIGMVLLNPGWEADYYQSPEIISIGCVGKIERHTRLEDGKYNILLKGLSRFRVIKEVSGKAYRRAEVELMPEINDQNLDVGNSGDGEKLLSTCREYLDLLPEDNEFKTKFDPSSFQTAGRLADEIAYRFDLPVSKKQAFLEEQDVTRRIEVIRSELGIKIGLINFSKEQTKKGFDVRMN